METPVQLNVNKAKRANLEAAEQRRTERSSWCDSEVWKERLRLKRTDGSKDEKKFPVNWSRQQERKLILDSGFTLTVLSSQCKSLRTFCSSFKATCNSILCSFSFSHLRSMSSSWYSSFDLVYPRKWYTSNAVMVDSAPSVQPESRRLFWCVVREYLSDRTTMSVYNGAVHVEVSC